MPPLVRFAIAHGAGAQQGDSTTDPGAASGAAAGRAAVVARRLELLIPMAASAVLLGACVLVSRPKTFWTDEAATWMLIADPSFSHLLGALWGGVEAGRGAGRAAGCGGAR